MGVIHAAVATANRKSEHERGSPPSSCDYDIRRGDWISTPTGRFRVTRYDPQDETIVGTDGARTYVITLLHLVHGDAILERGTRDPLARLNENRREPK